MRRLNDEQSRQAGYAVGVIISFVQQAISGDRPFTVEQERKIKEANEHLSTFTLEEQAELFRLAAEGSVKR